MSAFPVKSSRWSLLKSAKSGRRDILENSVSIHKFEGFNLIPSKRTCWTGFELELSLSDLITNCNDFISHERNLDLLKQTLRGYCDMYLKVIDNNECRVTIHRDLANVHFCSKCLENIQPHAHELFVCKNVLCSRYQQCLLTGVVEEGVSGSWLRSSDGSSLFPECWEIAELYYYCRELKITYSSCEYRLYSVNSINIYTREKGSNAGITTKELLSHQEYGIDNTGNVRVWPAEHVLLHSLLCNESLRVMFAECNSNGTMLELGGGLSALCGLGIAVAGLAGLATHIVLTDGHPDCVANQV